MVIDYDSLAFDYQSYRIPDTRIAGIINREVTGYESVLNVGAGLGSYEPLHTEITALKPNNEMIKRRAKLQFVPYKGQQKTFLTKIVNLTYQ